MVIVFQGWYLDLVALIMLEENIEKSLYPQFVYDTYLSKARS